MDVDDSLEKVLENNKLLKDVSHKFLANLEKDSALLNFKADEIILHEGDIGDQLYIIIEGVIRIYTYNKKGEEIVLARLERGDYFGEQALLNLHPIRRNASARALKNSKLLAITHDTFQRYLRRGHKKLLKLLLKQGEQQLITKLKKQLQDRETVEHNISSLLKDVRTFHKRQVLFRQGDLSDQAYYLLSGLIQVRFYNEDLSLKSLIQLEPGQFFGEKAIIENAPRKGSAVIVKTARVAMIQANDLLRAYQENININTLFKNLNKVYDIPSIGFIYQYQGNLLGYPVISTTTRRNGDVMITTLFIDANIFTARYANIEAVEQYRYEDEFNNIREIQLVDNRLMGVLNIGEWDDLDEIVRLLREKIILTKDLLNTFKETGKLYSQQSSLDYETEYICYCMQVKLNTIQQLIREKIVTLEEISEITGAGSICGGCRPKIIELLGGEAWIYVKIADVREHNNMIRSYRFQPINKSIMPYQAGQHIVIQALIDNQWITRSYTLTSVSEESKPYYEITVKREELGVFSRWLFEHGEPNSILRVSKPQGTFTIKTEAERPIVCFTAGIGITPFIAFARKIIASKITTPIHVDYSVHKSSDVIFNEEILKWSKQYKNISINIRETATEGRLNESIVKQIVQQFPHGFFYLCGPKNYLSKVMAALQYANIGCDQILKEEFINAGGPIQLESEGKL